MYPMRDIIVTCMVVMSLPICFLRPFFGVLVWTAFAFLNSYEFTWGIARQMSLAEAVAVPTLAGALIFHPKWIVCFDGDLVLCGSWVQSA
jgi:hypothetical protein